MTPEQAADKIYALTGVILGTDAARHIASYLSVMETRIAELEAALEEVRPLVIGASHSEARYPKARAALEGERDVNSD
jgi:hypothetical protein